MLLILSSAVSAPTLTGCATPQERRFQAHINYLASDELTGRGVGTEGIEAAARYIAAQFRSIGLAPDGDDGSYFQTFDMTLHRTLMPTTRLAVADTAAELKLGSDFIPFSFSSDEPFSGDVVFCGYGIDAPQRKHDDFVHTDIEGKVALIMRGEPSAWTKEGGAPTHHAMFRNKVYNAKDHGAIGVLIVNQAPGDGEADELVAFDPDSPDAYGIPAFHVSRKLAGDLFARGGLGSLQEIQHRMDAGSFVSARLSGVVVSGKAEFKKEHSSTRNVLGLLRGHGRRADEVVVVGAHYDHLGIRKPMTRRFKRGRLVKETARPQIHNGADDNASGTSGLIEVARTLAAGPPLDRSVLFVAFTAEESGLHGSKYYVEHPAVPLKNTVAMVNMDMIGRMPRGKNIVKVFGVTSGDGLAGVVSEAAAAVGLKTAPSPDSGGRSDQASFIRKDIPSLHLFSGQHPDYHQPSDDADKINAKDGARIVAMASRLTAALAERPERLAFHKPKTAQPTGSSGTPTYRVVMGLSPSYGDDGKPGMGVEGVSEDGPADLAGMKTGDRIVQINDKEVHNIYDYMAATRKNNPGDAVSVVVLREGRRITLSVTLAAAR